MDKSGDEYRFSAGDTLYCGSNELHQIKNAGNSRMRMICMIPILPGGNGKVTTLAPINEADI